MALQTSKKFFKVKKQQKACPQYLWGPVCKRLWLSEQVVNNAQARETEMMDISVLDVIGPV